MEDVNCLLHRAVRKGDYENFNELFSSSSNCDPDLLYHCIENSYSDSKEVISGKLEICKALLSGKEKFLNCEENSDSDENESRSSLHAENVHLELLKFLLTALPSVEQVFEEETVVHRAASYMNGQDFHKLCVFLIDHNGEHLLKRNDTKWKSPLPYILSNGKEILPQTLELLLKLQENGASHYLEEGKRLILAAIHGKRKFEVIDTLVKLGAREMVDADLEELNTNLLQAANTGQLHRLKFLIKPNADLTQTTICHRNLAHLAAWSLRQDKYDEFIKMIWNHKDAKKVLTTLSIGGTTPLHERLRSFRKISIDTLIQLLELDPENINTKDTWGYNLFLAAVRGGKPLNVLQTLVEHESDYKVIANGEVSALHLACRAANWDAVNYLAELGEFDANLKDGMDCTPLFVARNTLRRFEVTKELNHKVFDARKVVEFLEGKEAKDLGHELTSERIAEVRTKMCDPEDWKNKLENDGLAVVLESLKLK